jgi:hypothetical protein
MPVSNQTPAVAISYLKKHKNHHLRLEQSTSQYHSQIADQTFLLTGFFLVTIQVPAAARMKITAFWDTAPSTVVEVDQRLRGSYCLHH